MKKLQKGVKIVYHCNLKILPPDLSLPKRSLKRRRGRFAYTDEQVNAIILAAMDIDMEAAMALEVQARFGLRKAEVLNLRKTDVHLKRGYLVVWRGKGGRLREVEIPDSKSAALLERISANIEEMDLLFPNVGERRYQYVMEKACQAARISVHKTHNLRHHYAVKKHLLLTNEHKMADKEARMAISKDLGHNRLDVMYSYIRSARPR